VVDSTNRYAAEAARAGAAEGLVVVADRQEEGRGRLGRSWVAPPGSALLCSLLLRPELPVEELALLGLAAALAGQAAVAHLGGAALAVKWPNDLLVGEKKVAGILAEVVPGDGPARPAVVVGIGVNLAWPAAFDPRHEAAGLLAQATTLAASGAPLGRDELLAALLDEFGERYGALVADGAGGLLADYRTRCATIGQRVRVSEAAGEWEGLAEGVDGRGRLLVRRGDALRSLDAADVVHLRAAVEG